jgi:hypothetical protein
MEMRGMVIPRHCCCSPLQLCQLSVPVRTDECQDCTNWASVNAALSGKLE